MTRGRRNKQAKHISKLDDSPSTSHLLPFFSFFLFFFSTQQHQQHDIKKNYNNHHIQTNSPQHTINKYVRKEKKTKVLLSAAASLATLRTHKHHFHSNST